MNVKKSTFRRTCFKSLLLVPLISLTACSYFAKVPGMGGVVGEDGYFRDRQGDYLGAETLPRTQIPEGKDSYMIDDLLVVPEIANNNNSQAFLTAPRPRTLEGGSSERQVVIQKFGDESWIVVDTSPGQVWPRIREFWANSNIDIASESPTEGVLETGWFFLQGNVLTKEKIKVIVDTGFQDESSEIRLLHLSLSQATPVIDQVTWPEVSSDLELEYEMVQNLASYLADLSDLYRKSTVSFLAGNISSEGKASLVTADDGTKVLKLDAGYERSWAAVGRALERSGIEVISKDTSRGTYDVQYSISGDEEDSMGFFGKIFTLNGLLWKSSGTESELHSLRIQIYNEGSTVEISVESLEPEPAQSTSIEEAKASLLKAILNFIA